MNDIQSELLKIIPEDTPNPNSNKFNVNRILLQGAGRDFTTVESALSSPLAKELFLINGVKGIFIGSNFVTVSVESGKDWWALRPVIAQSIESFILSGQSVVQGADEKAAALTPGLFSPVELGIQRVLQDEIQPAVAMDGGHISFVSFENGIVRVQLRGACHSCPSSIVTLKMGIENRLKQEFPEVTTVEAV